ncbi:MAG TPA: PKD domain-containing protein, partial [Verrucomicrobiae bacterium]|nr:PKD domain-containing protein [Verrucomicrobiae bacterium]
MIAVVRTTIRHDQVLSNVQLLVSAVAGERRSEGDRKKSVGSVLPLSKATDGKDSVPQRLRPAIEQFDQWADEYLRASAAERSVLEQSGLKLAKQRRDALREIIQSDPATALKLATPYSVRRQLPGLIANELEERISTRGDFLVQAAIPFAGREGDFLPILRQANIEGRSYEVYTYARRLNELSQKDISLQGIAVDGVMALSDSPLRILEPEEPSSKGKVNADSRCPISGKDTATNATEQGGSAIRVESGSQVYHLCSMAHFQTLEQAVRTEETASFAAATSAQNIGPKKILLMRIDFSDAPGATATDVDATNIMSEVNDFVRANSFNQMVFETIDVTPLLRMPNPSYYYTRQNLPWQVLSDALSAARSAGYDTAAYQFNVASFSYIGFPWSGVANIGQPGAMVQSYSLRSFLIAHELGHNFGNGHANLWSASADSIIGPGESVEYGNFFDVMGGAHALSGHYNANFKFLAGWLTETNIQTVSTSGTYRVYAMDSGESLRTDHCYAIRIPARILVNSWYADYWIDFRQQQTDNLWTMNGAILKWGNNNAGPLGNDLLDMTPGTPDGADDAPLLVGRTFCDRQRGIFLTPVAKGGSFPDAYLDIVINIGVPTNSAPNLALNASATSANVGETISFSASAYDPDGDSVGYGWDFGDRSVVESSLNRPSASKSWTDEGEYVVRCTVSDLKGGEAGSSVIVRIGNPATYRVSGRVTLDGNPVEGVRVQNGLSRDDYRGAWTDSDGSYTIVGLSPGTYQVEAAKYGYVLAPSFANPISISSGSITGADFRVLPKGSVFISGFTPTNGPVGATVTISGNAFYSVTAVKFNDLSATFTVKSSTQISAIVPEGAISGPITVAVAGTSATSANEFGLQPTLPVILTQFADQGVIVGSNITFVVKTSGSGPLSYRWQKDNMDIPGATSSSYSILHAETNDAGVFSVAVSNPQGTETSGTFALRVVPPISYQQALDSTNLVWRTSANFPWNTQTNTTHDGVDAVQSGVPSQGADSWIETTAPQDGQLTFWWKVSSFQSGNFRDSLEFWADNRVRSSISGEVNWNQVSIPVYAGQTLRWRYAKNVAVIGGQNKAWLDEVNLVPDP